MGGEKQTSSANTEFYIGWMAKAPKTYAVLIKKYVIILALLVIAVGIILAVSQKKFGTGNFEFGVLTEVKGVYADMPVPNIRVVSGKNIFGNSTCITIPLVGYGKFGADGIIKEIEKEKGISLNGRQVSIKGTLLYNDGKIIMQVNGADNPVTLISGNYPAVIRVNTKHIGNVMMRGEIIDPKCFFGVMKPGEGKPHRDCAIRCILGGIPPMLHVVDGNGASNYYLIVGPNGEKMNSAVQDFVGEPVEITANAVEFDDWILLYVVDKNNIRAVSKSAFFQPKGSLIACAANCK